jgi:DNA-binding CsgD family transcriptional regulator
VERVLDRVRELALAGHDLDRFFEAATEAISSTIPNHTLTWYALDPSSNLITSIHGGVDLDVSEEVHWEYVEDDLLKSGDVVHDTRGVQTFRQVTKGRPERSPSYPLMASVGMEDQALVALRSRTGETWGTLRLCGQFGRRPYSDQEVGCLRTLAPHLAEGVRRGLLLGSAMDPHLPEPPGLVVLTADWTVESITPGTESWLAQLPRGSVNGELPAAVLSVAARTQQLIREDSDPADAASVRVMTPSGQWLILHGTSISTAAGHGFAVIVEPVQRSRVASLLMAAYGLTARERDVTRFVLRGATTKEISQALFISPHTVQEHLKSTFEKTGVRSRRELVSKVFLDHYDARVRDNADRSAQHKPARAGPYRRTSSDEPAAVDSSGSTHGHIPDLASAPPDHRPG